MIVSTDRVFSGRRRSGDPTLAAAGWRGHDRQHQRLTGQAEGRNGRGDGDYLLDAADRLLDPLGGPRRVVRPNRVAKRRRPGRRLAAHVCPPTRGRHRRRGQRGRGPARPEKCLHRKPRARARRREARLERGGRTSRAPGCRGQPGSRTPRPCRPGDFGGDLAAELPVCLRSARPRAWGHERGGSCLVRLKI